jgi:hypothetical protein
MKHWFLVPALLVAFVWATSIGSGAAVIISVGYDQAKAYLSGQTGQVAPFRDCVWVDASKDDGWECHGVFTGGGLRVNDVRIRYRLAERPTGPVPAIVSGPSATTAWTHSDWTLLLPAVAGLFMMSIAPVMTLYHFRGELAGAVKARRRRTGVRREIPDLRRDMDA